MSGVQKMESVLGVKLVILQEAFDVSMPCKTALVEQRTSNNLVHVLHFFVWRCMRHQLGLPTARQKKAGEEVCSTGPQLPRVKIVEDNSSLIFIHTSQSCYN